MRILSNLKKNINTMLGYFGFELVRKDSNSADVKDYIPIVETLRNAKKSGMLVGDYIEARHDQPGSSQETIDKLTELGVFKGKILTVCEIGPGSGRYLEKTIRICSPQRYEIYETSVEWRDWLVRKYGVIPRNTDGISLTETETGTIDLIHAHKVFSTIPLYNILHYFHQLVRVSRQGGKVVFDVITEDCMGHKGWNVWLKSTYYGWPHTLIPKQFVIQFFCKLGFIFDGSFFISQKPIITECFVFTNRVKDID